VTSAPITTRDGAVGDASLAITTRAPASAVPIAVPIASTGNHALALARRRPSR